jgi:hypothetical protein
MNSGSIYIGKHYENWWPFGNGLVTISNSSDYFLVTVKNSYTPFGCINYHWQSFFKQLLITILLYPFLGNVILEIDVQ